MATSLKLSDCISNDELRELRRPSNWRAIFSLIFNWAVIASALAIAIIWPNPITIVLGILILGGRQLGLGILNHDCAHGAFFTRRKMNDFVGHWLCGAPLNTSLYAYREYHLKHHKYAGTKDDPDLRFVEKYPVSRASLKRKLIRDITGRTGLRDTLGKIKRFRLADNYPWLMFHVLLLAVLTIVGAPWAYLMWWAAEILVYPFIMRLRQIGEHGVASNRSSSDPRENTSTTLVSWWEALLVAPNHVNYHLEHHQFAAVPGYHLSKLHKRLAERGYYDGFDCISNGYVDVLRRAVRPDEPRSATQG